MTKINLYDEITSIREEFEAKIQELRGDMLRQEVRRQQQKRQRETWTLVLIQE